MKPHRCPVCLGDTLCRPYEPLSYDICPRCGVEYGLEDDNVQHAKGYATPEEAHAELRRIWQEAGSPDWQGGDDVSGVPWLQHAAQG